MKHKFYGGVHPAEHKDRSERKAISALKNPPSQVVIPMNMHIGAPCKPIVSKGDAVKLGQQIGEMAGLGAPIHASVSGTVAAVEPRLSATGFPVMSVVIDNDFKDEPHESCKPRSPQEIEALNSAQLVEIIRDGGITGMGGAGFPTHVKISSALGKADTIIVNGAECEPYITADHRLMLEQGQKVIDGLRFIMKALSLPSAIIGIEDNKPDAIAALKALVGPANDIKVEALHTCYPQGAEKQLIQRITGREIPPGKLPADVGCCVFNVATVAACYDVIARGLPLCSRVLTVTGGAIKDPVNLIAPLGMSFAALVEEAGGFLEPARRVLSGGPMMGVAQFDLSVTIGKATNCVLCLSQQEMPAVDPKQTCIRCARCVNVCPMHLTPVYMNLYAKKSEWREAENLRLLDCMECGCCQYICPGRIPLVQQFRSAKFELRALAAKS